MVEWDISIGFHVWRLLSSSGVQAWLLVKKGGEKVLASLSLTMRALPQHALHALLFAR